MAGTPQPARIAVFGAGYVGLVTAAGFAELGHVVTVRDVVPEKIEALREGRVPIYEPGLDELLRRNRERLSFTLDVGEAIAGAEFVYVCVDTPPTYSGDADLSRVWTVVDELPQVTGVERPLLVMKSTVPVGTGEKVRHALDARGFRHVGYVANPEFTAEGSAVEDFRKPDRIVIGAFEEADGDRVEALHAEIDAPVVRAGVNANDVIVRPYRRELELIGAREIQETLGPLGHHRGVVARSHDIRRAGALRLDGAAALDLELEEASFGTARNGTYVPASIPLTAQFWRVVGLYLAEGHSPRDGEHGHHRLEWSFHPRDGDESDEHKRALLAGLWLGDGSWSHVSGGPSVVLEYGAVSRELADGMLRLLGELGIVARLKVGRTAKSTVDTYWLVVSGADQVERLLDLVLEAARPAILDALRRTKRIAPTGYRRKENAAWVRVTDVVRRRHTGHVYSLEVPPTHTFVTTGGLVVSNCFPKDSLALKQLASNSGYHFQLLNAVIEVNELQKRRVIGKLKKHLGSLRGTTVALLGLAFKPFTDDVREAPSIVLASRLLAEGAEVRAWDPVARPRELLQSATFCETPLEAVTGADAAVIVTEWPELRDLITPGTRGAMRRPGVGDRPEPP